MAGLYEGVLIDTPISSYFLKYLDNNTRELKNSNEIVAFFKETKSETIRNSLKRIWIEDFTEWTQTLNGITAINMKQLLDMEADFLALKVLFLILINYNSVFITQFLTPKQKEPQQEDNYCQPLVLYIQTVIAPYAMLILLKI